MGRVRRGAGGPAEPTSPMLALHVERLILHGLSPGARRRLVPAIEAELARLIGEHGPPLSWRPGSAIHLPGGSYRVPRGSAPEVVAATVARSLFTDLGGDPSGGPTGGRGQPP